MPEDGPGELIGPSGRLSLPSGRDIWPGGSQDIQCDHAQDGEVFLLVVAAVAGSVIVEADIRHPAQAVLDPPVGAHGGSEASGVRRRRRQAEPALPRGLAVAGDLRPYHPPPSCAVSPWQRSVSLVTSIPFQKALRRARQPTSEAVRSGSRTPPPTVATCPAPAQPTPLHMPARPVLPSGDE